MDILKLISNQDFLTLMGSMCTAMGVIVVGACKWVLRKIGKHDERIAKLENNYVHQEEFDDALKDIYRKMDEGFRDLTRRFDQLMSLLITNKS